MTDVETCGQRRLRDRQHAGLNVLDFAAIELFEAGVLAENQRAETVGLSAEVSRLAVVFDKLAIEFSMLAPEPELSQA